MAAPRSPPMTPQSSPSPNALPAEGETLVTAVAAEDGEGEHEQPERQPHRGSPRDPGGRLGALGAPELPARGPGDRTDRDGDEDHRCEAPGRRAQRPRVDHGREQCADRLAQALGQQPAVAPDDAEDRGVRGWISAMTRPAPSTIAAAARAASPAATTRHRQMAHQQSGQLAGLGVDAADALAQRLGPRRLRRGRHGWERGWRRLRFGLGRRRGWRGRRCGAARASGVAATGSGSATRKSSWRAPQAGQNRERALMRSPQLAQYRVSVPAHPGSLCRLAWVAARGGITSRRWTAGEPCVACSRPFWWRRGVPALVAAPVGPRARRPGRPRSCSPSTPRARWRPTTAPARRRSTPRRTPPSTCSARCRRRPRSGCACSEGPSPRGRSGPRARLEPRVADRPAGPRAGRAADPAR